MISSRRNPLVRRLKALSSREGRKKYSMLLLEGTHLLEEALRAKKLPIEIIYTDSWMKSHEHLLGSLPNEILFQEVTPSVLEASLTTVSPDGVATLFPLDRLPRPQKNSSFILALDRLQDPGNLGTLFRTALAAEIEVIWLACGADPLSQKVIRSSAGAILHLPYERMGASENESVERLALRLEAAAKSGYQVVASLVPGFWDSDPILPYWDLDWRKPTVLVLGNEGSGLHSRIQSCCTHGVTLPHSGAVQSLNVAAAAVPLLLERQRATMCLKRLNLGEGN